MQRGICNICAFVEHAAQPLESGFPKLRSSYSYAWRNIVRPVIPYRYTFLSVPVCVLYSGVQS